MKFRCFTRARLVGHFNRQHEFIEDKYVEDGVVWINAHKVDGVGEYVLNKIPITRIYCGSNSFDVMESVDEVLHILTEE